MLNKVILMGRLCADPELKQTQSGIANCRIRVAVNRQFVDKQTGERQADFINVTCWRNTAEFVSRYFHKGSMIIVEGSLRNNDWTDQNGVKHYSMEVFAESVQFGESKQSAQSTQNATQQPTSYQSQNFQTQSQAPSQQAYSAPQSSYTQQKIPGYYENYADSPQANATVHTYANDVKGTPDIGNIDDFEEILGDGEPPF